MEAYKDNTTAVRNETENAVIGALMHKRLSHIVMDKMEALGIGEDAFSVKRDLYNAAMMAEAATGEITPAGMIAQYPAADADNFRQQVVAAKHFTPRDVKSATDAVEMLKNLWVRDEISSLINRASTIRDMAPAEMSEALQGLSSDLDNIMTDHGDRATVLSAADMSKKFDDLYFTKKAVMDHIITGIKEIDAEVPLVPGDLCLVGARPSVGKSAFMIQMMVAYARAGKRAGYASLEMPADLALDTRIMSHIARIPSGYLNNDVPIPAGGRVLFEDSKNERAHLPYYLIDLCGDQSIETLKRKVRRLNLDVLFVDYLQLLDSPRVNANNAVEVGYKSKALKKLAVELKIPVIVASQLSRASDGNEDRPDLSRLRESGNLEQDASVVLMLWAPDGDISAHERFIQISKNRNARPGMIFDCKFTPDIQTIEPISQFTDIVKWKMTLSEYDEDHAIRRASKKEEAAEKKKANAKKGAEAWGVK